MSDRGNLQKSTGMKIPFGAILGIASGLMLIGSLAPWQSFHTVTSDALNAWNGRAAFIGAIIAGFATTVCYNIYQSKTLQRYTPYTNALLGLLGSLLTLVATLAYWYGLSAEASLAWGFFVTFIGGLLGIFSSIGIFKESVSGPSRGRGKPSRGGGLPRG